MINKNPPIGSTLLTDQPETTTVLPLNTKPSLIAQRDREAERQKLQEQLAELQRQQFALHEAEEAEKAQERIKLKQQYDELLADARDYRAEARNAKSEEDRRQFFAEARECERAASSIATELGLNVTPLEEDKPAPLAWYQRNHMLVALLQVVGVFAAIYALRWYFKRWQEEILFINKTLPTGQQMSPYDDTSIQKLIFEKLAIFSDLPIVLVLLFLVVPFVGFYLLPFLKARKDFHTEFYEELTPWQRVLTTTLLVSAFLLFLALSHSVKP